ncbi:unnamed protein product [Oreochromis niloticus]|nr:unnamed protein product [Mustela putorius furo]
MTHHSFGTPSALSPASFRSTAASTPAGNPLMDLATPPPSPHRGSSSPAAMLADSLLLPPSPQGWNSPSHPALGWQSPEQTPPSTSVSGASLWALGDPVCRVLFREPDDNDPHPGENRGQLSPVHNDEAATLLPTAVFELIKLTLKYLVMSLLQKHRQDVCQGCDDSWQDIPLDIGELDLSQLTASLTTPSGPEEPCLLKMLRNAHIGGW